MLEIVEENGDSVINSFGITLDSSGNYQFSKTSESQHLRFVADVYGYSSSDELSEKQRNQTAEDIIEYLCTDETYGYRQIIPAVHEIKMEGYLFFFPFLFQLKNRFADLL